ncbi:MAG: PAS domain S-box protein, partial [Ignavibacteriaceae bacterium]
MKKIAKIKSLEKNYHLLIFLIIFFSIFNVPNNAKDIDTSSISSIKDVKVDRDSNFIPDKLGDHVTVAGRVTVPSGLLSPTNLQIFIQDSSAGISIYSPDYSGEPIKLGDSVIVSGKVNQYEGLMEIVNPRITIIKNAKTFIPAPLTIKHFHNLEAYEGMYVTLNARIVNKGSNGGGNFLIVVPKRGSDVTLMAFISKYQNDRKLFDNFDIGEIIKLSGIVGQYDYRKKPDSFYQILPRFSEDISILRYNVDYYIKFVLLFFGIILIISIFTIFLKFKLNKNTKHLIESEKRFSNLAETTSSAIIIYAKDKFVYANTAAENLTGYTKEELLNLRFWDIIHPGFKELVRQTGIARQKGEQVPNRYELKILKKDGKEIWIDYSAGFIEWKGQPAIIGTAFEITNLKRTENTLRESEEVFRTTLYSIGDAVITTDVFSNIIHMNPVAEKLTGWKESEAYGKIIFDVFKISNELTHQKVANPVERVLREGIVVGLANHTILISRDGTERPIADSGAPIRNEEGQITGVVVIFRDQTEERKAKKALEESERVLRKSQSIAQLGSYELNISAGFWTSSKILDGILGIDENYIRSIEGWEALIHPGWRDSMADYFTNEVIGKRLRFDKEYKIIRKNDGKERWVHGIGELEFDAQNNLLKMTGTIQDITGRKKMEDNIRKLNRVYAVLSNVNQTIVRQRDRQKLFDEVCRIAVEDGKLRMAWIGLVNSITNKVDMVSSHGVTGDYLEKINIDLNDKQRRQGPTGKAIISGKYFIVKDIENDGNMLPWKEDAKRLGYRSLTSFPLKVFGVVTAVFNFYAGELNFFDENEIKLLEELAMDISFALEFIEREEARQKAENELSESEETFKRLFEESTDPILLLDSSSFVDCNRATVSILGYSSKEEVINKTPWELSPTYQADGQTSSEKAEKMISIALERGFNRFEWIHLKKDGLLFTVEVMLTPIILKGKQIFYVIWRDISERKKAENELRKSEERFRNLVENINDVFYITDGQGKIFYCSPNITTATGFSHQEIIGKSFLRLIASIDRRIVMDHYLEQTTKGVSDTVLVFRVRRKDGKIIWAEQITRIVRDTLGNVVEYRNVARDITERKRAEEELQKSREDLLKFFEDDLSADFIATPTGQLLNCNKTFLELFGFKSKEEALEFPIEKLYPVPS